MSTTEQDLLERATMKMRDRREGRSADEQGVTVPEPPKNLFSGKSPGEKLDRMLSRLQAAKYDSLILLPGMSALFGHDVYAEMQLVNANTIMAAGILPPAGREFLHYLLKHSEAVTERYRDKVGMESLIQDMIADKGGDDVQVYTGMMQLGHALAVLGVANIHEAEGPIQKDGKRKVIPNRPAIGITIEPNGRAIPLAQLPEVDLQLISEKAWYLIEQDAGAAEPFLRQENVTDIVRTGQDVVSRTGVAGRADDV